MASRSNPVAKTRKEKASFEQMLGQLTASFKGRLVPPLGGYVYRFTIYLPLLSEGRAVRPIVDRHTLIVLYSPQVEEAKDFFRRLRWVLEQDEDANQDVGLIEH